jgi:dimethylhistidine N-methyltransferase
MNAGNERDQRDAEPYQDGFCDEVLRGLAQRPKRIAPKFFYDEVGCQLFEEICQLDEYYLTRTEIGILRKNATEICRALGPKCLLVEFGSGSNVKIRILLDHLFALVAYVPVDIARTNLLRCSTRLSDDYPDLSVLPVCADFTTDFALPEIPPVWQRIVAFFPGSTIGNLEPVEAEDFLRRTAMLCGPGGGLLIGIDLKKDPNRLERAYNDARGVTARFNLNLLDRINRSFGADIPRKNFRHYAFYNKEFGRIEMHLVSTAEQIVQLNGSRIAFAEGEQISTEHSYKYTVREFADLATRSGWGARELWTDPEHLFCIQHLVAR